MIYRWLDIFSWPSLLRALHLSIELGPLGSESADDDVQNYFKYHFILELPSFLVSIVVVLDSFGLH